MRFANGAEHNIDLSIIIVSWNTKELLDLCLASIYKNPPEGSFDVWVVDNASSDGTCDMVHATYPDVKIIENQSNLGFARGNNLAIRQSTGRYVLLLNTDTVVHPGALFTLVQFMDTAPQTGAAGSRLLNMDRSLQYSCHPDLTLFREFWRLFHLDKIYPVSTYPMDKWDKHQPREVEVLMGACLILRRQTLDQVGYLDENYFFYTEEVDLCHRIRKNGWKLHWVPEAEVVHYGAQSTKQIKEKMFIQLYFSKIQFFRKNHGRLAVQIYKLIVLAASIMRLMLVPFAFFVGPTRRREHFYLSNLYRRLLLALPQM